MNKFLTILSVCLVCLFTLVQAQQPNGTKLRSYSQVAKMYCAGKGLNTRFYILIDLSIHAGLKRFFVWDLEKDIVSHSFLVSHGCGSNPWSRDNSRNNAIVSNADGSHCSSVGKYIIGGRSYSNWGVHIKYALLGQDKTNSNAVKREIVFHSWESVPDSEIFPAGTPEGWGCPAISNNAMLIVDKMLAKNQKKTLMWVIR